jgi:flavin reductase (DIM6/NTAB) family NADH-FMN oxidoreductase RutF
MTIQTTDKSDLRKAFGAFATGVTVVTVGGQAPHGMTANSFTAVSLDPPLLLICVERDAVMHSTLSETGQFGVSVLASDQEEVARYFADHRRPIGAEEFAPVEWQPGEFTGTPMIAGALAHFECEVWRSYDGGDHTIFLGILLSLDRRTGDDALLFAHGQFCQISHPEGQLTP